MRLRIVHPGQEEQVLTVDQDSIVVGRGPECDVVVDQPFVSKRHAKILRGLVVADLGSSNGTLVDGRPVTEPVVVTKGEVVLGRDGVILSIEDDGEAPLDDLMATLPVRALAPGPATGEDATAELRARKLELEAEVRRLTEELTAARASAGGRASDELRRENEDLRERLDALKADLERGVADDAESLQARLAREQLAAVRERNAELERELAATRGGAGPADPTPAAPAPASELFQQLQRQNRELREELERVRAEGGGGPSASAASELFFKLQAENRELKQRLAERDAAPPAPPAGGATSDAAVRLQREKQELESRLHGLEADRDRLRAERDALRDAPPAADGSDPTGGDVAGVLAKLLEEDVDGQAPPAGCGGDAFVVFEQTRFLRQVERVVTRLAGEFIQLFQLRTMLPDRQGDYRGLAGQALRSGPNDPTRDELTAYLDDLGKWLVAALGAHRTAAARFAAQLKHDLSERALTQDASISGLKKLNFQRQAELWRRANEYLDALTPDIVDERIDALARDAAQEFVAER